MIFRMCAFTTRGWKLADKIENIIDDSVFERKAIDKDTDNWVNECFESRLPIIFIGAMGIAVRKIAPFVQSKLTDSPVIVVDETGKYIIPILSNHVGGANELARKIADAIKGELVITTATDVNDAFAVDIFAKNNGLLIINKDGIKRVSKKILEDKSINVFVSKSIEVVTNIPDYIQLTGTEEEADVLVKMPKEMPEADTSDNTNKLYLIYKPYILGVGCKKDTEVSKLNAFIEQTLADNNIDESLVAGMASIDLKSKEKALLYFEAKHRIPFVTFDANQLQDVQGEFSDSDFVKEITGVSNVCERAAMKLAGKRAELILPKLANDGMTIAISKRKARIDTWET